MIHPVPVLCTILLLMSGLGLYAVKDAGDRLDKDIARTVRETDVVGKDILRLIDQFADRSSEERLRKYVGDFLPLKPVTPGQMIRWADLTSHLPPPRPFERDEVAIESGARPVGNGPDPMEAAEDLPVPPIPPSAPIGRVAERDPDGTGAVKIQMAARASKSEPAQTVSKPILASAPKPAATHDTPPRDLDTRGQVKSASLAKPVEPLAVAAPTPDRPMEPRAAAQIEPRRETHPEPARAAEVQVTPRPPAAFVSTNPIASGSSHQVASGSTLPVASGSSHPAASGSTLPVASASSHPAASGSTLPVASGSMRPAIAGAGKTPPGAASRPEPPMRTDPAASPRSEPPRRVVTTSLLGMARVSVPAPLPARE